MDTVDRDQLADFLRRRRAALAPEDVGLPRGTRRRIGGLRREEVAALCDMSVDYYSRLEQRRGPRPSEQMLAAIARGLHLTLAERDHLFRLAGYGSPERSPRTDHVGAGLMRVLERLDDTPAQVLTDLLEPLVSTRTARALFGDESRFAGLDRSLIHRWFTRSDTRDLYPEEDHARLGRAFASLLREACGRGLPGSRAPAVRDALLASGPEFRRLWDLHEVGVRPRMPKRLLHPRVGPLELDCQVLHDLEQAQTLMVYTAAPGSESHDRLRLLSVIGEQSFDA